jgi:hypothetical protein
MDRYDEAKHVRNPEDPIDRERDERNTEAPGDVLGLGGSRVPKMPGDPSAADDNASGEATRALDDDASVTRNTAMPQSPGATSIDMGAGGTGTQIDED